MCTCSHDEEYPEDNWNLYQHIERVEGLNVVGGADAARGIFKPHARRLDVEPFVSSDADAEFVVKVWFTSVIEAR